MTVVALAFSLCACGGGSPAATSRPPATCTTGAHLLCVDAADGGKVERARVGETVEVLLESASQVWTAPQVMGPPLLRPIVAPVPRGLGIFASYKAVSPGETALEATARARCTASEACPQYVLLWRVEIRIS